MADTPLINEFPRGFTINFLAFRP